MTALGYVDGRPVPEAILAKRLAELRRGPMAACLPAPGTAEDRQLRRWTAQVILTEQLCAIEAPVLDQRPDKMDHGLDQQAAVELGSITAAAYEASAAVRAVYAGVTAAVTVDENEVRRYWAATHHPVPTRWLLQHRRNGGPAQPLGPATLEDLPRALATAVRDHPHAAPGTVVRAVDQLGSHEATIVATLPAHTPDYDQDAPMVRTQLLDAARRGTFNRWLDHARATRVRLIPGFEHPADPHQPDHYHRH